MFSPFVFSRNWGEDMSMVNLSLDTEKVRPLPAETEVGDASGELDILSISRLLKLSHQSRV